MGDNTAWEQKAKEYPWHTRTIPPEFSTPQENNKIACDCIEWWNTRSPLFCCFFPCFNCFTGAKLVDGTDPSVWKEQLERFPNGPESMRGVWWLKYNHAHEELVTIFNETDFLGEINEDGTDGYGRWERSLRTNWSRDKSCFGQILLTFAKIKDPKVGGLYNMKDGILTLDPGMQWVFRVDDNEWWKVHYVGDVGSEDEQKYDFIYQWLKVIDKDGQPTEHWAEYVKWSKDPLPHRNCGEPWLPCWPCCSITTQETFHNMCRPNPEQLVMFRE